MRLADLQHRKVAIWGAGREGRAAHQMLRRRFAQLPITMICRAAEVEVVRAFADARTAVLAHEPSALELQQFEVVIKSPGISLYRPELQAAQAAGVAFISGTSMWFAEHADAKTIVVSGTKGKSTTSALIAHLLRAAGKRVALAGNIGMPLLELFEVTPKPDWWVIELSSFQIADLHAKPNIALLLNLFPEHLDWHGDFERYAADKLRLLGASGLHPQHVITSAQLQLPPHAHWPPGVILFGQAEGFHVRGDGIAFAQRKVLDRAHVHLPGEHNLGNVCAAFTAVSLAGEDVFALAESVSGFQSLPHRLQNLGWRDGLEWVNDSISTTPHASIAALQCFPARAIGLIVGGFDRGLDWQVFVEHLRESARHSQPTCKAAALQIITQGQNGARIHQALLPLAEQHLCRLIAVKDINEAVVHARQTTPEGGLVLLSPGAPSFGQFADYAERGREFARLAGFVAEGITSIGGMGL